MLKTNNDDFITIVSGLPRSGTSMMMQMLAAGGIPIITDNIRQADADNPKGYYEFERVKQLSQDASWLVGAYGKAVKMVYRLLYELPREHKYKVIMMNRHITEVVASQDAMLEHHGKAKGTINSCDLAKILQNDLDRSIEWLQHQDNFAFLKVNYNHIIIDPQDAVSKVNEFLDCELETRAMIQVLDFSLYRNRT